MSQLILTIPSESQFSNTVKNILQGPDYVHLRNNFGDAMQKIKETLANWLFNFFVKIFSNAAAGTISGILSVVFMVIGITVILIIIVVIIVKVARNHEKKKRVMEILGEKIDHKATPLSLRAKASEFKGCGDFRRAIRFDFIALLLLMHERSLLYLDETKTNGEIYEHLSKSNFFMINIFKAVSDIFNLLWYGHKQGNSELYKEWSGKIDLLWNEVIGHEEKNN